MPEQPLASTPHPVPNDKKNVLRILADGSVEWSRTFGADEIELVKEGEPAPTPPPVQPPPVVVQPPAPEPTPDPVPPVVTPPTEPAPVEPTPTLRKRIELRVIDHLATSGLTTTFDEASEPFQQGAPYRLLVEGVGEVPVALLVTGIHPETRQIGGARILTRAEYLPEAARQALYARAVFEVGVASSFPPADLSAPEQPPVVIPEQPVPVDPGQPLPAPFPPPSGELPGPTPPVEPPTDPVVPEPPVQPPVEQPPVVEPGPVQPPPVVSPEPVPPDTPGPVAPPVEPQPGPGLEVLLRKAQITTRAGYAHTVRVDFARPNGVAEKLHVEIVGLPEHTRSGALTVAEDRSTIYLAVATKREAAAGQYRLAVRATTASGVSVERELGLEILEAYPVGAGNESAALPQRVFDPVLPDPTQEFWCAPDASDLQEQMIAAAASGAEVAAVIIPNTARRHLYCYLPPLTNGTRQALLRGEGFHRRRIDRRRGNRVRPSDAAEMPKLLSGGQGGMSVIDTGGWLGKVTDWAIQGIEIGTSDGNDCYNLVAIGGNHWAGPEGTLEGMPDRIVVEKCYVHGNPNAGTGRGVMYNAAAVAVRDNYFDDVGLGRKDGQQFLFSASDMGALGGWNYAGPLLFDNNRACAGGINLMLGGSHSVVGHDGGLGGDITITRNHFLKKPEWMDFTGSMKNIFETKTGYRYLIEGNTFENSFGEHGGTGLLFKSSNQDGDPEKIYGCSDITVRLNKVITPNFLASSPSENYGPTGVADPMKRLEVYNNLHVRRLNPHAGFWQMPDLIRLGGDFGPREGPSVRALGLYGMHGWRIEHNTHVLEAGAPADWASWRIVHGIGAEDWTVFNEDYVPFKLGSVIRNNVFASGDSALLIDTGSSGLSGRLYAGTSALANQGFLAERNVVVDPGQGQRRWPYTWSENSAVSYDFTDQNDWRAQHNQRLFPAPVDVTTQYPLQHGQTPNAFPATVEQVGFRNAAAGDWRLAETSQYLKYGTDGRDPGCDIEAVERATAHCVDGQWVSDQMPTVPPVVTPPTPPVEPPVVEPPVVTPPAPPVEYSGPRIPASLRRNDGLDTAISGSWGVPLPSRVRDLPIEHLRLFNADTGTEIATTTPVLLHGTVRAVRIGAAIAESDLLPDGSMPHAEYRFVEEGLPRLAFELPTASVPLLTCWPKTAEDLCDAELVPGPLTPMAARGDLPEAYRVVDDDYPRAHERDWGYTQSLESRDGQWSMGRNALAYDPIGTLVAYGSRIGGPQGITLLHRALVRQDRYVSIYAAPNGWGAGVQWGLVDAMPACYWLTGHDDYRVQTATAARVERYRWGHHPRRPDQVRGTVAHSGEPRPLAMALRVTLAAVRLGLTAEDAPLPDHERGFWGPFDATELGVQLDAIHAALVAAGRTTLPLRGSWGGDKALTVGTEDAAILARPDYAPPGTPTATVFQVGFILGVAADCLRLAERGEAPMSAEQHARTLQLITDALDYYGPMFLVRGWAYAAPVPGPWDGGGDATGDGALAAFWARASVSAYRRTGVERHLGLADRAVKGLADQRLPNGKIGGWYDTLGVPSVRKNFDEAYCRLAAAISERALPPLVTPPAPTPPAPVDPGPVGPPAPEPTPPGQDPLQEPVGVQVVEEGRLGQ